MSGDMMAFPDTVEEFMEQYKIVDREQVYSNGIEFVPIFRMQQWFDHVKHSPDDLLGAVHCGECKFWRRPPSCEGLARCETGETGIRYRSKNDFCSRGVKMEVSEDA